MKAQDPKWLTQSILMSMLNYDPETGVFTHLKSTSRRKAGALAGSFERYGIICINRHDCRLHRLAWLYMTGKWPVADIDHIDGNKHNNRWANLREATRGQNLANRGLTSRNKSGFKGVCWSKQKQKWRATISGRHLGLFDDPEEAHAAYVGAAQREFGEFARAA